MSLINKERIKNYINIQKIKTVDDIINCGIEMCRFKTFNKYHLFISDKDVFSKTDFNTYSTISHINKANEVELKKGKQTLDEKGFVLIGKYYSDNETIIKFGVSRDYKRFEISEIEQIFTAKQFQEEFNKMKNGIDPYY